MASSQEFVDYVLEQMKEAGNMRARKMFGDYGFYCNDQFMGLICDNQCYLKVTTEGEKLLHHPQYESPYEGAKPHLVIEDFEDIEALTKLVQVTCEALMKQPQKKRRTGKKNDGKKETLLENGEKPASCTKKAKKLETSGRLSSLPNIGKEVERQLTEVGITTVSELEKIGARAAWLRIQQIDSSACYNRLCALEGALQGIRWHALSDTDKAELKQFYLGHKVTMP